MVGVIDRVERELRAYVAQFDAGAIDTQKVDALYEQFDRIERMASTTKTLFARRVNDSREWARQGYANAAEYAAAKCGKSVGAAKDELAASQQIASLPIVEEEMRSGSLSQQQANVIADAASKDPKAQSRLVAKAKKASFKELKDECNRTKAAADRDPEATHRRIHGQRSVRTYTDGEGAWNLHARGTVADGSRIEAALKPLIDEQFEKARAEERRESYEAYAFDALVEGVTRPTAAQVRENVRHLGLIRVDLEALRRGALSDDEYCEITGVGPIPVSVARAMLTEAIVKLVITKGDDVLHVTHLGRGPKMAQMIALLWQQPLCTVEGCCRTRVEIDHRIEWRKTKHTRFDECDPLCKHHHDLKTYEGWSLIEGTGERPMVPPGDPRHPDYEPEA